VTSSSLAQFESDMDNLISYLDHELMHQDLSRSSMDNSKVKSTFEARGLLESIISREFKCADENKTVAVLMELRKIAPAIQAQGLLHAKGEKECDKP
jgi:hypothetical protein